jgi:hypothetical protein
MLTATIAGVRVDIPRGTVTLPRVGVWSADLWALADAVPSGNVAVNLAGVDMPCHVQRAESALGMVHLRLVGGRGGMGKTAGKKFYRNPTVRSIVQDLARDAGETLSTTCLPDLLARPLQYWTTLSMTVGVTVQALADVLGDDIAWRILFDGTLWLGRETWPMCPAEVRIMEQDGANASQVLGTDALGIWPGTTIGGRRVDLVKHEFGGESPRSTVWWAEGHA